MTNNEIIQLSEYIYNSAPLNKGNNSVTNIEKQLINLSKISRIELLRNSFIDYDVNHNYNLCLSFASLWDDFEASDWKSLILKMFPRIIKYEAGNFKHINTGCYFDIAFLNGVLGVSPFRFIFNSDLISIIDKENFYQYLKHFGEYSFFNKERELIENVVNFYDFDVLRKIVTNREKLAQDKDFSEWYNFQDACDIFTNKNESPT
ncbi:MAG: hypothetical protein MUF42_15495 [Cytophagaceae bacterium]|jgi:hypothetical protein|nr:hypothetical protein [Cytophagaceae bacterium]